MHTVLTVLLWLIVAAVGLWILIVLAWLSVFTSLGKALRKIDLDKLEPGKPYRLNTGGNRVELRGRFA